MSVRDVITGRLLSSPTLAFSDSQVGDTLLLLIKHGVTRRANAIHIEPQNHFVVVRYRIDGTLRGFHKLPLPTLDLLVEKLKNLADLEPAELNAPQEGHFTTEVNDQPVYVRVSLMPVLGGEKAVLHLMPERQSPQADLASLGFWGKNLDILHEVLARPQGLVSVAGPKHSGKTATLYSMLQLLHTPGHSLATIEEHHTHRINGLSQSYVHSRSGTTFLKALQAVLRQDPNIIMLSNLPDEAVTELAIHAASTGHLVLNELYADDAVSSALHLRTMTRSPFMLATALRATVGQRLLRKLCHQCRQQYPLDETKRQKLEKAFGITTPAARARVARLEQAAREAGLGTETAANEHGISYVWRANTGGCEACSHTGYNGRIAINEVLSNDDAIQKKLLSSGAVTPTELHHIALKNDFIPMGLDGLIKALQGLTTVVEVLRAVTIRKP
ncbi:MAG TPA: ATPase, T2SS/T4P/T4SS family [Candidatus Saccharimonadales bacterium]|nr:ATPase, T2SS/T4P/T4SS family [Candidatus Saccharimonadales bacterium]